MSYQVVSTVTLLTDDDDCDELMVGKLATLKSDETWTTIDNNVSVHQKSFPYHLLFCLNSLPPSLPLPYIYIFEFAIYLNTSHRYHHRPRYRNRPASPNINHLSPPPRDLSRLSQ